MKTLPIAFFLAEVIRNYIVILDHDWIHVNKCVPSSLHQFLTKWVGDDIEVVLQMHRPLLL